MSTKGIDDTVRAIEARLNRYYSWDDEQIAALGETEYWRIVNKLEHDLEKAHYFASLKVGETRGRFRERERK